MLSPGDGDDDFDAIAFLKYVLRVVRARNDIIVERNRNAVARKAELGEQRYDRRSA
jgi:hypothetical protein